MRRAVVAGGSVAGLLAARVLHDFADEVVLVEPDQAPDGPATRPGTPHAEQFHLLLGVGQALVEHWFPGMMDRLATAGAVRCPSPTTVTLFVDGRPRPAVSDEVLLPIERPVFEWHLRAAVLALPNVRLVRGRVTGLVAGLGRVEGVRLGSGAAVTAADLVVDATGRSSRLGEWLARLDYPAPRRRRLGLDLGYATATFAREPGQRLDGLVLAHSLRTSGSRRPGVSCLAPVGTDRWTVLVSGYGADRPGRDEAEFLRRCRAEPVPAFARLADECAPVSGVSTYRFPHSVRRDFDTLPRMPAGLVAVGDAVASFNPVYGQGIPSAALHASALGGWLRTAPDLRAPAVDYFRRVRVLVDAVWQTSLVEDLRMPHVTGERPRCYRLRRAVTGVIDRATMTDPVVTRRFLDVVYLRDHPRELLRPRLLGRALVADLRRLCGSTPAHGK